MYDKAYEVRIAPYHAATAGGPTANQNGVNLSITGVAGEWSPGYVPHIIRGAAVIPRTGHVRTGAVHVGFNADMSVQGTATRLFTIVLPTTVTAAGEVVYYSPTYSVKVKPGRVVQAAVTAAATAGSYGHVVLYVEPSYDVPGNVTSMTSTT